jgi:hypothetical protein
MEPGEDIGEAQEADNHQEKEKAKRRLHHKALMITFEADRPVGRRQNLQSALVKL